MVRVRGSAEAVGIQSLGEAESGLGMESMVSHSLNRTARKQSQGCLSWLWSGQLISAISWWGGRGVVGLASRVVSLFWTLVEHLDEVPGAKMQCGALKRGTRLGVINVLKVHSHYTCSSLNCFSNTCMLNILPSRRELESTVSFRMAVEYPFTTIDRSVLFYHLFRRCALFLLR